MARAKKILKVTFADGPRELPSSVTVKCNSTGKVRKFYTPKLVPLINKKYKGSYTYFLENFVMRGYKKKGDPEPAATCNEEVVEDLTIYKNCLKMEHRFLRNRGKRADLTKDEAVKEAFYRRFPEDDINDLSDIE